MVEAAFFLTRVLFLGMLLVLVLSAGAMAVFLARGSRPARPPGAFRPPVSVVIPARNEAGTIGPCLEALLADGYPRDRLDVTVVDDGSTDGTPEVVRAYPGVRLIRQAHGGKAAALNTGLARARHDVLVSLDADTLLVPGSIAALVEPLADPRVGAVSGTLTVREPRGPLGWFQGVEYLANAFSRESFASVLGIFPGLVGALASYRRSALGLVGGFKPDTAAEDLDVGLELARRGFAVLAARAAVGRTEAPRTLRALARQRVRWMKGCMQAFLKHRALLVAGRPALRALVAAQVFWIVYALLSLPLIAFHVLYWLPLSRGSVLDLGFYLLRWGSLLGPLYMVAKIPAWGIDSTYFFGVLAGLLWPALLLAAHLRYQRPSVGSAAAIVFFFPYTLLLSALMVGSLGALVRSRGRGAFVR